MPDIGRPESINRDNKFSKISIRKKDNEPNCRKADIGDTLNEISGVRREQKFVDKKQHNNLGKDGFLKLLAHQLKNQDPLKPMDQKKFAAELAQFSQLEQMTNMNQKLDKMTNNAPTENKFFGASFLGREVVTNGTTINYNGEDARVPLPYYLPKNAKEVIIRVYDSNKQMIAQLEKSGVGRGQQVFDWNGVSLDGTIAAKDTYKFEVLAWDNQMDRFRGETRSRGKVTGVEFDQKGETILVVNGVRKVALRDVHSINLESGGSKESIKLHDAPKMPGLQKNAASSYNKIEEQSSRN